MEIMHGSAGILVSVLTLSASVATRSSKKKTRSGAATTLALARDCSTRKAFGGVSGKEKGCNEWEIRRLAPSALGEL